LVQRVMSWPVRDLHEHLVRRRFARTSRWRGLHFGLYRSFAEARADAPANGKPVGFALDDDWFANRAAAIASHDYPMLFHLAPVMPGVRVMFDLGGHFGLHYTAYRPYLTYRPDLRWVVCERPEVASRGEELRRQKGLDQLSFVTDFSRGEGADVLISAGCIQYVEKPFVTQIAELARRPPHVLLNKIPVFERETRVTLQNTGWSFSPCWLLNREELVAGMRALGYQLRDAWNCPERAIRIPLHSDHSIPHFSGFYFSRGVGGMS
jgi:putative methyltransferase (TIGR04325 family)